MSHKKDTRLKWVKCLLQNLTLKTIFPFYSLPPIMINISHQRKQLLYSSQERKPCLQTMTIAWNSGKSINVCQKLAGEYLAANVAYLKLFCEHSYIVFGTLVGNVCASIYSYYCFYNSLDSLLWVDGLLFMLRGHMLTLYIYSWYFCSWRWFCLKCCFLLKLKIVKFDNFYFKASGISLTG